MKAVNQAYNFVSALQIYNALVFLKFRQKTFGRSRCTMFSRQQAMRKINSKQERKIYSSYLESYCPYPRR